MKWRHDVLNPVSLVGHVKPPFLSHEAESNIFYVQHTKEGVNSLVDGPYARKKSGSRL